ncbi:hypothetical protein EL17_23210 [Anditalea andensis]|uniref:Uncharacterized protein n=2 Tax=Anditalea andensis TaxID=1048983 RepID=A0A074LD61_9BACT|nr:hypothetical protein EL17_23210 [Anditalea andensis]
MLVGCEDFLNQKPDQALITPNSLEELRALLDNNTQAMNQEPTYLEGASDDILIRESLYNTLTPINKNIYIWDPQIYDTPSIIDWTLPFSQILYANTVLFELEKFGEAEKSSLEWKDLKGSALFYRAYAYFSLARQFCLGYDKGKAEELLGLPLRTSPVIDQPNSRANLKETFALIINDLQEAESLLGTSSSFVTRPTKPAASAMLSRVYLYMGFFQESLNYADLALTYRNEILDYNAVNSVPARPFVNQFEEVIFYSDLLFATFYFFNAGAEVVPDLVGLYEPYDLRKSLFFFKRGEGYAFKGQYSFQVRLFGGLATDELYLNKAECHARLNQGELAVETINKLLEKRFVSGMFEPLVYSNDGEALQMVKKERRKQLLLRGIRWGDLKRYNLLPGEEVTLTRNTPDGNFDLQPHDLRYAFPIPEDEILLSGIAQNPR